ncbi:pentapeptide repeat-containing protein [filamentous cyanobacterium CCP5]|nr:pentapeptide repeat-containing protein [filamentous cyanobacterium CCP5]
MRERFRQWLPKIKAHRGWIMGEIAVPVFLGLAIGLWLLPSRSPQPDDRRQSPDARPTLAPSQPETPGNDLGEIAALAGGVFLVVKFRFNHQHTETIDLSGADLNGADLSDADLNKADLIGADLIRANLGGANLSGANLSGANLVNANLSGADLSGASLRYANLSGVDLRFANLSGADLRCANLSGADLNCTLLSDANLSDANLSGALLFFINLREVLNLEPLQLEAQPAPFLCNAALPAYSQQPDVNPNRACDRIPLLLSDRYDISLEEAQGIVDEARQHRWD